MLALHSQVLQAGPGKQRYCCTATPGRSSTSNRVQLRAVPAHQECKYTPKGTALGLTVAATTAEPLQQNKGVKRWKYVLQSSRNHWSYSVTIPLTLTPGADTKRRVTKAGFLTPESAARTADCMHLAMFDPATNPEVAQSLNFPVENYSEADIKESEQLLRKKGGENLKLRDPNSKCTLRPLGLYRTQLMSTIKGLAKDISSLYLGDSQIKYVGAQQKLSTGSSKQVPAGSNTAYRTSLKVSGVAWSLQISMTYAEAVVAYDLARVAAFGDGHSAIQSKGYPAADIELMRKDTQQTAPDLLKAAAIKLAEPRSDSCRKRSRTKLTRAQHGVIVSQ